MLNIIMEKFKGIVDYYVVLMFVIIGIITLVTDVRWLKEKERDKDIKIAKGIGFSYIVIGPLLFLITRFI